MELIRSYKIKLLLTKEQINLLDNYFIKYAKAVNFFIDKIKTLRKDYEWIPKDKQTKNKCFFCKNKDTLTHKFLPKRQLICLKCYNSKVGDRFIRKLLYATRGRKRGKYDVRDAVELPGTEYAAASKRAVDTIKSNKKQLSRVKSDIKYKEKKLKEWTEVLEDKKVNLEDGRNVSARFTLVRQPKQKVDRYKHILYKDNPSRGKTESGIRQEIKALEKTIEKLNKRLKESKIEFGNTIVLDRKRIKKAKVVDLWNTALKDINEKFLELGLGGKRERFFIDNNKGKKWLGEVINLVKSNKKAYPLLLENNKSFYFSYPVVQKIEEPKISKKTKVMGIDRGVNQLAVTAIIDKPSGKPHNIKFYSGKELMSAKIKYQLIRKKFTGTKNINKRYARFGKKVIRISDYLLHNISRQIVNDAKNFLPLVIAMEDLKITQGERKPKRGKAILEKKIRFKLSNFTYGKLQNYIEYKALQVGIPAKFIKPEYTSQECSICHEVGKRNQGFFMCINSKCAHKMNADLNASINIANALYKQFNS